ncbi:MAG: phosphoglycerate kinase [Nanoarchaeota archaeon]|nr:phosphoglycerate kinase [Nanoarchaeota archaeon]MBU1321041.1 phosphoglycerate kinase [Nanoarchaeota archaeon]MBU1598455.1 phosphoglycerate kinase [Nanoarchaeota archaeon]MBU2441381.1 phosphoglycerate kinase [Nanoarchaeota archaeon]
MKTIKEIDLSGKRVLLRAELNVPLNDRGDIVDDYRLRLAVPTIKYILEKGAKQLVIMGHLGRPDGKVVPKLKMDRVAVRLMKLIGKNVYKVDYCVGKGLPREKIILLENLRFDSREEANDEDFAQKLSVYGDVYVNDSFATSHREHASFAAITKFLPGCIGLRVKEELENLDIKKMKHPIVTLIGGAKLKTKIPLIQAMVVKAEKVLIGGAMIFTFYAADGLEIGKSMCDTNYLMNAKVMLHNEKLVLPKDVVIADYENKEAGIRTVAYDKIPKKSIGLDIGEKSVEEFKKELRKAETIIWNGPMGYYEKPPFDKATNELIKTIAEYDKVKIIGGGDTADAVNKLDLSHKFTFLSSGGGAALEFLSGKKLAAFKALEENEINFFS